MTDAMTEEKPRQATRAQLGQLSKFLPLPIMPHHALWFEAGPVTFGVEGRVIQEAGGPVSERSASIHIFSADREQEYVRFDCFADFPHYHYILNKPQHNVVWGYDAVVNGPMLRWALSAIRERLPDLLRNAGEPGLAARIEREGFDLTALDKIEPAIANWEPRPVADLIEETKRWYAHWKSLHPQFNTDG